MTAFCGTGLRTTGKLDEKGDVVCARIVAVSGSRIGVIAAAIWWAQNLKTEKKSS